MCMTNTNLYLRIYIPYMCMTNKNIDIYRHICGCLWYTGFVYLIRINKNCLSYLPKEKYVDACACDTSNPSMMHIYISKVFNWIFCDLARIILHAGGNLCCINYVIKLTMTHHVSLHVLLFQPVI